MEHTIKSNKQDEMINITDIIREDVRNSKVKDGVVIVFVPHTTAGITINENADPDVVHDILNTLQKVFPKDRSHLHMEGNSHAHIKASAMGSSCSVMDLCQYFGHKKLNFFSLHNIDTERKIIKLQEPPLQPAVEFYNPVHCVSFCGYTKTQYIQRELFQPLQM
jgi:secondary thiamine-phosphate synthase enzyme